MADKDIRHVIVLMLENRSFDQMLGCLKKDFPELEGIDPIAPPRSETDSTGTPYYQRPIATRTITNDPLHEYPNVARQLKNGFVYDYSLEYPNSLTTDREQIMAYFKPDSLPALHQLARRYTICDHWFSSVPGPTWANRLFVHSGTSKGYVQMWEDIFHPNLHKYNQDTIYDRLNKAQKKWKIYHADLPQSIVLTNQRRPENFRNYSHMDEFYEDVSGRESEFPEYCFIEPQYGDIPKSGQEGDDYGPDLDHPPYDDHPPHDVMNGQKVLAKVYNAVRAKSDLWSSSLLVVLYDEHGGFYDHVSPPKATVPDDSPSEKYDYRFHDGHKEFVEAKFDRYGVRVPALLISPWVARRIIDTPFDHTSLLKYLIDKWTLDPLTKRVDTANSIRKAIFDQALNSSDMPAEVSVSESAPELGPAPIGVSPLNTNQKALMAYQRAIEEQYNRENPDWAFLNG